MSEIENHVGGYTSKVDDIGRLVRVLFLGSEGGTFYVGDQALNAENAQCITRLIEAGRGPDVVRLVVDFSVNGRTANQNGLVLAMAMCARQTVDATTKSMSYENLHLVCRTPTQLFTFIAYCEAPSSGRGWSRAHRRAIANWYLRFGQTPEDAQRLAVFVTKYKSHKGWSHRDVIRLAHPKPNLEVNDNGVAAILKYVQKGFAKAKEDLRASNENILKYLQAVEDVKAQREPATLEVASLAEQIRQHHLSREHLNTQLLNFPDIWEALLEHMPTTAMIRNLGKMSAVGMLSHGNSHEATITGRLGDIESLKKAMIHPFTVLLALVTYRRGNGERGHLTWSPNEAISEALDSAFYLTFSLVEPTNKRFLLALDVSASMFSGSVNVRNSIHAGTAAAAMALVTARTELHCEIVAFSTTMVPLNIRPDMTLSQVEDEMRRVSSGTTDCTLPMQYALEQYESTQRRQFDVFVVYTANKPDNHMLSPAEVLRDYRQRAKVPDAKLVVCAMKSNGFTIADPEDVNMLDVAGFDSNAPQLIWQFVAGELVRNPPNEITM